MAAEPEGVIEGWATHYGASYEGQPLGCGRIQRADVDVPALPRESAGGAGIERGDVVLEVRTPSRDGVYHSDDPTIAAVAWPSRDREWPCGQRMAVCASPRPIDDSQQSRRNGDQAPDVPPVRCIVVVRQDSCPGCSPNTLDLSEAGIAALGCVDVCRVSIQRVE